MRIQLIRHATLVLRIGGREILVDPMLASAGSMDPVANAGDDRRIPLVGLPTDDAALDALLAGIDGAIVTHLHRDHWDDTARARLRKDLPIACQPGDEQALRDAGFTAVTPIVGGADWLGLALTRTDGEHGRGAIGEKMGRVSGFVIRAPGEPVLYLAGDTVWCDAVARAITTERPEVIVVNSGAAQFLEGGPITMDVSDVRAVLAAAPDAEVVAVHFETVNHCRLGRAELRRALRDAGMNARVAIPEDGEELVLTGHDA